MNSKHINLVVKCQVGKEPGVKFIVTKSYSHVLFVYRSEHIIILPTIFTPSNSESIVSDYCFDGENLVKLLIFLSSP